MAARECAGHRRGYEDRQQKEPVVLPCVIGHGLLAGNTFRQSSLFANQPIVDVSWRAPAPPQIFGSASTKEAAVRFDYVVEDDHILYEIPT